ncbi:unnamed protein product [Adineta steineri]|uniref:Ig-like domain-containing protein n=2 Tax=Adineta steineri TaxID=433720 RepID=A0A819PMP7_9BILA|nr:unnamed protein product [Adineta steineri]CAF4016709.1 unnamed protein product [Adineta steineri]
MRDKDGIIFDPIAPRAGERLIAKCTLVGLTDTDKRSVSWELHRLNDNKKFFLATDDQVFQFAQPTRRLYAEHDMDSSDWYLIFDPLDREDYGDLTCMLADTGYNNSIFLRRRLVVYSEPFVVQSSTKDIEVSEGDNILLQCFAQGLPPPQIQWMKADATPLPDGNIRVIGAVELPINDIQKQDRGIYKCLAINLVGYGDVWTLKVNVKFPPYIRCPYPMVGQAVSFMVDIYVECYVHGYPPPRITWYKNDYGGQISDTMTVDVLRPIWNSYKYKIEATIPEPNICTDCILSRLTIINVEASDLGSYVINATTNDKPYKTALDQVFVYETPDCQQFITHRDNIGCKRIRFSTNTASSMFFQSILFLFVTLLMTSMTRSSITGLYHPNCSLANSGSSIRTKTSSIDCLLNADKSGFVPSNTLMNSSRSFSNIDLSNSSSSSYLEQTVLQAQMKRAISCNETMEASIKRLRGESQNSLDDLKNKNESLERSLHESKIKVSELEHVLDKTKQQTTTSNDTSTPISVYEQQINTLQNEKLELKLQIQNNQNLHSKEVTQLEQTIHELKHQLTDTENKLKLSEIDQEKLNSLNKNNSNQLIEKTKKNEQLQKRVIEFELMTSTMNSTNVVNQSLVNDVKRITDIRYENEQLKKEIELLKLKCNDRILHDEEIRMLRKQVDTSNNYRTLIAKQEAEILKLREQLANKNKIDII